MTKTKLSGQPKSFPPSPTVFLALVGVVAASAGCSTGEPSADTPDEVELVRGALTGVDGLTEQGYVTFCSNNQVPLPPKWGTGNIGTGAGMWTKRGNYEDSFLDSSQGGDIYTSTTSAGICVINAHDSHVFDVICQNNSNGKACFWEAAQSKIPPSGTIALVPAPTGMTQPTKFGQWTFGAGDQPIRSAAFPGTSTVPPVSAPCTNCHTGQNAFIAHEGTHPLNLTALWTSSAFMVPVVPSAWSQNTDPGSSAFNAYPTSSCLSSGCHTSTVGGRFSKLNQFTSENNFCKILAEVTNRPASQGGMPPTFNGAPNICDPGFNCARQIDPFVKTMLKVGCGITTYPDAPIARATGASPTAVYSRSTAGPSYLGDWEHVVADNWSGSTHQTLLYSNRYTDHFGGWAFDNDLTGSLPTPFQPSVWTKAPHLDGNFLSVMVTGYDGVIAERGALVGGIHHNVNATLAAGAPSAYLRNDEMSVAAYRGEDSNIHEVVWNGSTWLDSIVPSPSNTTAIGDPIGYTRSFNPNGSSELVWVCKGPGSTSTICQARHVSTNAWISRAITTKVKIKDDGMGDILQPVPNSTIWGQLSITYVGTDGLHVIYDPTDPGFGTPTEGAAINSDTTIASAPAPYTDQNGYLSVVYRAQSGSTHSIIELRGTSTGGFTKTTLFSTTTETLTDNPTVFVAQLPWLNTIFYRTSTHHVYQSQWSYSTNGYVKSTVF